MKSKLIRVKVWYEHDDGVTPSDASGALEKLLLRSLTLKEASGVRVHSYEVGNATVAISRPEPDF